MLWWILGILFVVLTGVCLLRAGVWTELADGGVLVRAMVGPFQFRVYPRKETPPDKEAPDKPEKAAKKKTPGLPAGIGAKELRQGWTLLRPALSTSLCRLKRGIRITPLTLSVTVGGQEDAAGAALRYGRLNALVWSVMPVLEQLLDIRDPQIHVGLDFDRPDTAYTGQAAVHARVGTLLALAAGLAVPVVRWLLAVRRNQNSTGSRSAPHAPNREKTAA